MKKVTLLIAMAALLVFAGCKKDKEMEGTTLKASIEQHESDDDKTSLNPTDGAISWMAGDKITVYNGTATATFRLTSGEGSTNGTFTYNGDFDINDNTKALYPETGVLTDNSVTFTLPQQQNVAEPGTFASGANPMLGLKSGDGFMFGSICGCLGLKLTGNNVDITAIEIVSENETLAGTVTGYFNNTGSETANGTNSVRLNCTTTLTAEEKEFFIVLLPGTLGSGFTMNIYNGDELIFTKTTTSNLLMLPNKVKIMNPLNVEATPAGAVIDLTALPGDYEAQDGDILTGTISGNHKISIANNATVTLSDVDITSLTDGSEYAGITCLGNANIILKGTNNIVGGVFLRVESDPFPWSQNEEFYHHIGRYPGIYIPSGYTLTIDGNGTLNASPAYVNVSKADHDYACYAAGIGGGYEQDCGNIVINGGTIVARGGGRYGSAGIGGATSASCGDITITGGTVTAIGGGGAAGIGSGMGAWVNTGSISSSCGDILISGGTVTATGGNDYWGAGAGIGSGEGYGSDRISTCGVITITSTVTQVTANRGIAGDPSYNNAQSIGAGGGNFSTCGTVTIENGANVIQN